MPTIPKSIVTRTAKQDEDSSDPIDTDFTPPTSSLPDGDSQDVLNALEDTTRAPLRLSLKSSKPTTNILSAFRATQSSIAPTGSVSTLSGPPQPFSSLSTSKPLLSNIVCHPGLFNMGHTCYVNSCVQAIMFAPYFRDSLSKLAGTLEKLVYSHPKQKFEREDSFFNFIRSMSSLSTEMEAKSKVSKPGIPTTSIRPTSFLHSLSAIDARYGAASEQQDVQEFFVFLLSSLDDSAKMMKEQLDKGELVLEDSMDSSILENLISDDQNEHHRASTSNSGHTNWKKRIRAQADHFGMIPNANDRNDDVISIHIGDGSKNAKRAKLEEDEPNSHFSSQEAFNSELNHSILPNSQELAGDLSLSYESQSLMENGGISSDPMVMDAQTSSIPVSIGISSQNELVGRERMEGESSLGGMMSLEREKSISPKIELMVDRMTNLLPHELFQGELTSTFQCMECERESGRPEAFFDISLPIEKGKDLPSLLGQYFAKSILGGQEKYDCESCRQKNEAFHYQRLSKLPAILTIHLKRFSWSSSSSSLSNHAHTSGYALRSAYAPPGAGKLNFHVNCPYELQIPRSWLTTQSQKEFILSSMSGHTDNPSHPSHADEIRISRNLLISSQDAPLAYYHLHAVIFHTGSSASFGHYTAAIRLPRKRRMNHPNNQNHPSSQNQQQQQQQQQQQYFPTTQQDDDDGEPQWALFDDHHVSPVSHAWVMLSISERATSSSTAYILLYEKMSIHHP